MFDVLLIWVFTDAIMLISFLLLPVMRGEDAFFGVRVSSEDYQGAGRDILRRYRMWIAATFVEIKVLMLLFSFYWQRFVQSQTASTILMALAGMILYAVFHNQAKVYEVKGERQRFASSLKVRRLSDYTKIPIELAIAVFTIVPFIALAYFYPILPERIPIHWNWRGEPDGWARKSIKTVFLLPTLIVYMQVGFILLKHGLVSMKMTLPAEHAEEYLKCKEESLEVNMKLLDWIRVLVTTLMGTISLNIVFSAFEDMGLFMKISAVVIAAAGLSIVAASGYYIYRLVAIDRKLKATVGRVYVQRQTDAEHWRGGGLIYYNPDDPSLFVEKMVGIGYTINFGNKRSYIYILYLSFIPFFLIWALMGL